MEDSNQSIDGNSTHLRRSIVLLWISVIVIVVTVTWMYFMILQPLVQSQVTTNSVTSEAVQTEQEAEGQINTNFEINNDQYIPPNPDQMIPVQNIPSNEELGLAPAPADLASPEYADWIQTRDEAIFRYFDPNYGQVIKTEIE